MTTPLTPAELAEMRAITNAASADPWVASYDEDELWIIHSKGLNLFGMNICGILSGIQDGDDAVFIERYRSYVLRLLDEVERLREALAHIAKNDGVVDPWGHKKTARQALGQELSREGER
jgi:hypothetical protein